MNQRGFTLIEVMVVVAIVAALSAIAVPGYQNYIRKAALIDVLRTVTVFKTGIELCSFDSPSFVGCSSGQGTIPEDSPGRYLTTITAKDGVISAEGSNSLTSLKLTATPAVNNANGVTRWATTCESDQESLKKLCLDVIK